MNVLEVVAFRGTMEHIWWSCPRIRSYWNAIFKMLCKILGITITPKIESALLGDKVEGIVTHNETMMEVMFAVAKLIFAKNWGKIWQVRENLALKMSNEKMARYNTNQYSVFEPILNLWDKYCNG